MLGVILHSIGYWHRRARSAIHQLGRVDDIHGQAQQDLHANRAARRTRPISRLTSVGSARKS
ncbi:hypothetical protein E2C01_038369 [Portunus trituberculatus]|uniref:Uncharacterized protein n=1 Tax=Portunus trituberculatus TaxID=210409 RepID=A0A5B7FAN4_PORTR|nr:hypothetical protein [Portunus trituberculatus]